MKNKFENSFIPKLRSDLSIKIINDNSDKYIILSDPKEYAPEKISLPLELTAFLQFLDGTMTIDSIIETLKSYNLNEENIKPYIDLIFYFELMGFLESHTYFSLKEDWERYNSSPIRPAVCSGNSYPDSPEMLIKVFDSMVSLVDGIKLQKPVDAILAPHLDFRTGLDTMRAYALAYSYIKSSDSDLFVIFGTAHYRSSNNFMLSQKDFATPLGLVETDRKLIEEMKSINNSVVFIDELAHRFEHSIEFQVVLLKYFFPNKPFKILPVLVGSYNNYIRKKKYPNDDPNFKEFIKILNEGIDNLGCKTVFIASGDLAHIGRKFNDNFDAKDKISELIEEDNIITENLKNCNSKQLFNHIMSNKDKWKVCGLAPFYTLLEVVRPRKGYMLQYGVYDEKETNSAVSFASLAFEK